MQINLSLTAAQNMLALINADNGTSLTSSEITLGTPLVYNDPEELNDRNTELELSAVADSGYAGTVDVRYYRLDLDNLKGGATVEYTRGGSSTLESALESYATTIGLVADELELVDDQNVVLTELPVVEGAPVTLTLRAQEISYLYIGETSVTLNPLPPEDEPLEDVVMTTDLSGWEEPA